MVEDGTSGAARFEGSGVEASRRVAVERGVVFGRGGGRELRADVYTPPPGTGNGAGLLLVHGGRWSEGDRGQLAGYGILLGRLGFTCVACEYRLSGEARWPAALHDVKAALRWMRTQAASWGVDPDQIAVSGNSAGAHLALMAAGTANDPAWEDAGGQAGAGTGVAACISFYGPADLSARMAASEAVEAVRALMGEADEAAYRAASPLSHVGPGFPPTLLIHGTRDNLVSPENSVRMSEALRAAGVPVELHMYADAPHAFDAQREFGRQCADVMALFLRRFVTGEVGTISEAEAAAAT